MKKILFVLSVVALVGYGCNKHEDKGSAAGTGMQQEQGTMQTTTPADTNVGSGSTEDRSTVTDEHLVPSDQRTDGTMDTQTSDPQRMESPSDVGTGSMNDDEMIDDTQDDVNRGLDKNDQLEDHE